jgi:hypothetical protein
MHEHHICLQARIFSPLPQEVRQKEPIRNQIRIGFLVNKSILQENNVFCVWGS